MNTWILSDEKREKPILVLEMLLWDLKFESVLMQCRKKKFGLYIEEWKDVVVWIFG